MRWFFSLLILTNLALAGWLYWATNAPQTQPLDENNAFDQNNLQLLSEMPEQSLQPIALVVNTEAPSQSDIAPVEGSGSTAAVTEVEEVANQEQEATCIRISPIAKISDLEALTRKLTQMDIAVHDKGESFTERQTYWVVIPPYKTSNAARKASAQLAKAKVRDFLVVRSGELENAISLGLFSQKEGAEKRLSEIFALKLDIRKPEIRIRTSSMRSHWLTIRLNGEAAAELLQQELDAGSLQGTPVECRL